MCVCVWLCTIIVGKFLGKIIGSQGTPCLRIWPILPNCSLERLNKLTCSITYPTATLLIIMIVYLFFPNPTENSGLLLFYFALIWFLMNFKFCVSVAICTRMAGAVQSCAVLTAWSAGGDYRFLCSAPAGVWISRNSPCFLCIREQNNSPIHWKKLQPARHSWTLIFSTWILTSGKVSFAWFLYWP